MSLNRLAVLVTAFSFSLSLPVLVAQEYPREVLVPFGYEYELQSQILREPRPILVSLPAGYEESEADYPILVLLDGSPRALARASLSAADYSIPDLIIVTIVNTDRIRDLSTREVEY